MAVFPVVDPYIENGKLYWPDANVGSEKYYELDWTDYLAAEEDTLDTVSWVVPASGVTEMHTKIVELTKTRIKLSADVVNEYEITCILNSKEQLDTQKHVKKISLKVIA